MSKRDFEPEDREGQRLLGAMMAENFWTLYHSDNKSVDDYRYMIATYTHTISERGTLINMLNLELEKNAAKMLELKKNAAEMLELEKKTAKILELENSAAKTAELEKNAAKMLELKKNAAELGEDKLEIREDGGEGSFYNAFHSTILKEWNEWIKALDPLTQASALSGKPEDWYKPWCAANPDILTSWIYPGAFAYTKGPLQGSGKTSLNARMMGDHVRHGGMCAGNVQYKYDVEGIIWSTKMSVVLRAVCVAMLRGKTELPMLMVVDEMAENMSGIDPLAPKNKAFDKMSRSFRKLNMASCYISHKRRDFPDTVLKSAVAIFVKPSRNRPDLLQIHKLQGKIGGTNFELHNAWYRGLPDCKDPPYKTDALAPFDVDVDFNDMWTRLSKLEMGENQYQFVLDWLDNKDIPLTPSERKEWSKRIHKAVGHKLTYNDVGAIVGVSGQQVMRYLKEEVDA